MGFTHSASEPLQSGKRGLIDEAELVAVGHQAQVGIVLPEMKPVLRQGGEHAIGFGQLLGDEIVDENANVGFLARKNERLLAAQGAHGVDAGHQPLGSRLFIARGPVNLSGKKEPPQRAGFQIVAELGGVEIVVFDGVAQPGHMGPLQTRNGVDGGHLDIFRQAGGEAVEIVFTALPALGFKEELMALLVGEAVNLVFDGGAVARANPLDHPLIEGGAVEAGTEDIMGPRAGAGKIAGELLDFYMLMAEGEGDDLRIAGLLLHARKVDGAAVDARGRAGLEPPAEQAVLCKLFGDAEGRRFAAAPAGVVAHADVNEAVEKSAGAEHHRSGPDGMAGIGHHASDLPVIDEQRRHGLLAQGKMLLLFEHAAHTPGILAAVILGAGRPDGGTLGAV